MAVRLAAVLQPGETIPVEKTVPQVVPVYTVTFTCVEVGAGVGVAVLYVAL